MKQIVAVALLSLALMPAGKPVSAADGVVTECTGHGCDTPRRSYGSGEAVEYPKQLDPPPAGECSGYGCDNAPPPSPPQRSYGNSEPAEYPKRIETRATRDCYDCDRPRKKYDSVEVVKTRRDVDHSRMIRTKSVIPTYRYRRARPAVRVPVVTVVQYVVHQYHVVDTPMTYTYYPAHYPSRVHRRAETWDCRRGHRGYRSASCRQPIRVRY
jgi:hypothetical protein